MTLPALVRRVDEDRWLASRFADADVRARLEAIYALNYEIARTSEVTREPGVGLIRLEWWREALAEVHAGAPARAHPALQAYAAHAPALSGEVWDEIVAARAADMAPAPFAGWQEADAYLHATAGAVFRLAAQACAPGLDASAYTRPAALAWGYVGLVRALPFWTARGRTILPGAESEARARAGAAYRQARDAARTMPARLFPAFGYLRFTPLYLRGETPALLKRQLLLVWASATGSV